MKILGINHSNDAAAALVVDGRVVAASQEERFSRLKHDASFPDKAIDFCLKTQGITLGDLAHAPLDALALVLGRDALRLQRRAQGVDEEPVRPKPEEDRSRRETLEFAEDVWEEPVVQAKLKSMLENLMTRIRVEGVEVRRLTLALRYTDREEAERSVNLPEPTALDTDFLPCLPDLLRSAWSRRVRLRAVTLRTGRVYRPSPQMELFSEGGHAGGMPLQVTIDRLRRVFGPSVVIRGYALRQEVI